jgi:glycosyltransferase involved in cell wall biosynthesis
MKLFILTNKISWFGKHSGYECLTEYLPKNIKLNITKSKSNLFNKFVGKLIQNYTKSCAINPSEIFAEVSFINKISSKNISHILYVDNRTHILPKIQKKSNKVIGTIHFPMSIWDEDRLQKLTYLDNAIILYKEEVDKFSKYISRDKIHIVRHGIDIDFFKPGDSTLVQKNKILFVGHFLRDFEMFIKVYNLLQEQNFGKLLELHFIIPKHFRNIPVLNTLSNLNNIFFHENLSDEELLEFYQTSYLMLMPMIDSGANTAIIQAIATGLPVITTDVGGIRTYGGGEIFEVVNRNEFKNMANLFTKYYNDSDFRNHISMKQRNFALEQLDWNSIAKQHLNIYETIFLKKIIK